MSTIVADASFCGAWILPDEISGQADILLASLLETTASLNIPTIWYYEMGNLLRSAVIRNRIKITDADNALRLLNKVPISACDTPTQDSMIDIMKCAIKHKLTFYDASYIELSLRLKATLYTADKALIQAAKASNVACFSA